MNWMRLALGATMLVLSVPASANTWEIDTAHSSASFSVRHMMISTVHGAFGKMTGTVAWSKPDYSDARVDITIDASSIDTHDVERDTNLRGPDFFDVARFPTLTFKSKHVGKDKLKGHLVLVGDLTIHGVTKEIAFDVTGPTAEQKAPWGAIVVAAEAKTTIHRKDFGLKWNQMLESGGVLVGDDVQIAIAVELDRK